MSKDLNKEPVAPVAEETKADVDNELIKIVAGDKSQIKNGDTINVGINGRFFTLKCGEELQVPKNVARLLEEGGYIFKQVGSY